MRIDGRFFRDEHDALWSWRGATEFLHFARFLRGEDPRPVFEWARRDGRNVLRLLARVDPDHGWPAEWAFYKHPEERPDFVAKLHEYFDLAAEAGLRVEYTVITYPMSVGDARQLVRQAIDIVRSHWNVFIEVANEPHDGDIDCDTEAVMRGVDRSGVLMSSGAYVLQLSGDVYSLHMLDYVTTHPERNDEWPRKDKDAMEVCNGWDTRGDTDKPPEQRTYWPGAHRPVVNDEREKAGGGHSLVLTDFASATGVSRLYCPGSTFHFEDGLHGLVPADAQAEISRAVADVEAFIPIEAQTGQYTRGGFSDLPIVWDGDSGSLRDYGSILGDRAYVVVVRKAPSRTIVAAPGWKIVASLYDAYYLERA